MHKSSSQPKTGLCMNDNGTDLLSRVADATMG